MLFAREISVGGCLFVLFWLGLFMAFNIPFQNILRRIFPINNRTLAIIEIVSFFIAARVLARLAEPIVVEYLEKLTRSLVDTLINVFDR